VSGLKVSGLSGGYGKLEVLHEIDLSAEEGQLTLLAGANGAGKSTLMSMLIGVLRPREGTISLDGEDLTGLGVRERLRRRISLVPEGRGLFPSLTVLENLRVAGTAIGLKGPAVEEAIERAADAFPIIRERLGQSVGQLSGGQQQMVAIGRCLMADPRLVLLDEPSMGLAPIVWGEVLDTCRRLAAEGRIVLLVEQRILDAIEASDHCAVMHQGRIVRAGTTAQMVKDDELFHDYVGASR
jgi:branched-chain amino acid transport system ATP-binding protein